MAKLIHMEDNLEFQRKVRHSLASLSDLVLYQFGNFLSFAHRRESIEADLYVIDRHLPYSAGEKPSDDTWRYFAKYAEIINPDMPILILSNSPPKDKLWRPFRNIKQVFSKKEFDAEQFKDMIEFYLNNREARA